MVECECEREIEIDECERERERVFGMYAMCSECMQNFKSENRCVNDRTKQTIRLSNMCMCERKYE